MQGGQKSNVPRDGCCGATGRGMPLPQHPTPSLRVSRATQPPTRSSALTPSGAKLVGGGACCSSAATARTVTEVAARPGVAYALRGALGSSTAAARRGRRQWAAKWAPGLSKPERRRPTDTMVLVLGRTGSTSRASCICWLGGGGKSSTRGQEP